MTVGKKISGIKIHLGVDTLGLPNSIHGTTAKVTDRDGALEMLKRYTDKLTGGDTQSMMDIKRSHN